MNKDWENISYLKCGNERQVKAYHCLNNIKVIDILNDYNAVLVGTIPIEIDIDGSDLDIICEVYDFKKFEELLIYSFVKYKNFKITYEKNNVLVCNFVVNDFEIEIYATDLPIYEQNAYRHMLIEYRLLKFYGLQFKDKVISLKKQGLKTEPAFAKLLYLSGNAYHKLLKLENLVDDELPIFEIRN